MTIRNWLTKQLNLLSKKERNPLINILTRTSNRPIGFEKCFESVKNQTYRNVRHLVSYDNPADLSYIKKYKVETIKVYKDEIIDENALNKKYEPYNLYCNELLKEVKEGWIMFLDDDDMLLHDNVLKEIINHIRKSNENTLFFWYTRFPDGTLLPSQENFKNKKIVLQQMDTACFSFHSKYKNAALWDAWWAADFRFIEKLAQIIPKHKWLPFALTQKNNFGDQGRRNDIEEKI